MTDDAAVAALLETTHALHPHLEGRVSQVPGGGLGLYTTVELPAGKPVVLYFGELRARCKGRYCIDVSNARTLDAEPVGWVCMAGREVENKGRLVNDARGTGFDNNLRYAELMQVDGVAFVVMYARRRVARGEELFASYGRYYWRTWGHLLEPGGGGEAGCEGDEDDGGRGGVDTGNSAGEESAN